MQELQYRRILEDQGLVRIIEGISNIRNLLDIKIGIDRCDMSELLSILTLKGLYDGNIPLEYKQIDDNENTQELWAIQYSKLFSLLGYNSDIVRIKCKDGVNRVVARVTQATKSKIYLTKAGKGKLGVDTKIRLEDYINKHGGATIEEETDVRVNPLLNQINDDMIGFTQSIVKGDIEYYSMSNIEGLYEDSKYTGIFSKEGLEGYTE